MSRKRKLKKQLKRRAQWIDNLEDLYLRRADEAFLEAARPRFQELEAASLTDLYSEVTDRSLAGALTGGDPERVSQLLARIRRDPVLRPLVMLAEAVDLLGQGRREPAAARLAALGEVDATDLGVAWRLPARLLALADPKAVPAAEQSADGSAPWRDIVEMARLSHVLEARVASGAGHPEGGPTKQHLPRSLELEDPSARAVWDFYRALEAVGKRNFRPGPKILSALARAVESLRREGPIDRPLAQLLRETDKRLRVLAAVRELEQTVRRRRRRGARPAEDLVLQGLASTGLDARLLKGEPPALLRPLQHALRTRWRGLLELVLERRGTSGLAALFAARPELLAADPESGTGAAEARRWAEANALLASGSFGELATFLGSADARVESPGRLAALWSLELWARREDAEETDLEQAHVALVRLIAMANAVADRFAAVERPQVARFLRDELLELCDVIYLCDHFLDAAEVLLEHLGDDPRLLAVALASAVSSRDDRAQRKLTDRIAALGPARADQEALLRVADNVAAERPEITVPALTALKPLFTGACWSQVLDRVAPEAVDGMRGGLVEAAGVATEDPEATEWILDEVRRDLELFRPLLDGRPELGALDLAFDCYGADPSVAALAVSSFVDRFEGLEPALVLYRQAAQLREAGVYPDVEAAIVEAVIDRLNPRWQLWARYLVRLTDDMTPKQMRRLRKKIRGFSKDQALDESDRETLKQIWQDLGEVRKLKAMLRTESWAGVELPDVEAAEEPEPKPRRPRARRPRPVDDRQLDLF